MNRQFSASARRFTRKRLSFLNSWLWAGIVAAVLSLQNHAVAGLIYDLNYSDASGDVAFGQITANPNGDGSYTAISGFFTVSASSSPALVGTYTLLLNPNAPANYATSPLGAFWYDNQLFPTADPYLDTYGVLFGAGGTEINLWGSSAGHYSLYAYEGGSYTLQFTGSADTTLAVVPERVNLALEIFGAVVASGVAVRRMLVVQRECTGRGAPFA